MYKYHSGKSCDYGQAWPFKCVDHLEKLLCWIFHKISSANKPYKEKILWIRKNNYIIFWLWNVYYYNILSYKKYTFTVDVYINYACAQFSILQNFYGFNVIIALKYVSYAVLLGIEEEITSEPEP